MTISLEFAEALYYIQKLSFDVSGIFVISRCEDSVPHGGVREHPRQTRTLPLDRPQTNKVSDEKMKNGIIRGRHRTPHCGFPPFRVSKIGETRSIFQKIVCEHYTQVSS
jgi:hypothetical protein